MNETGIWKTLLVKLRRKRKSEVLGEKRVPLSHCLRHIPRMLTRDRKRASAVRSRRVIARLCAVEPQAVGAEDCGLPQYLQSFHHNASKTGHFLQRLSSLTPGILVIIVRNI